MIDGREVPLRSCGLTRSEPPETNGSCLRPVRRRACPTTDASGYFFTWSPTTGYWSSSAAAELSLSTFSLRISSSRKSIRVQPHTRPISRPRLRFLLMSSAAGDIWLCGSDAPRSSRRSWVPLRTVSSVTRADGNLSRIAESLAGGCRYRPRSGGIGRALRASLPSEDVPRFGWLERRSHRRGVP